MTANQSPPRFLRRRAASKYLLDVWAQRCSEQTLANLAYRGGGPEFRRVGRDVVYEAPALDAFAQSRLSAPIKSTSETPVLEHA